MGSWSKWWHRVNSTLSHSLSSFRDCLPHMTRKKLSRAHRLQWVTLCNLECKVGIPKFHCKWDIHINTDFHISHLSKHIQLNMKCTGWRYFMSKSDNWFLCMVNIHFHLWEKHYQNMLYRAEDSLMNSFCSLDHKKDKSPHCWEHSLVDKPDRQRGDCWSNLCNQYHKQLEQRLYHWQLSHSHQLVQIYREYNCHFDCRWDSCFSRRCIFHYSRRIQLDIVYISLDQCR